MVKNNWQSDKLNFSQLIPSIAVLSNLFGFFCGYELLNVCHAIMLSWFNEIQSNSIY